MTAIALQGREKLSPYPPTLHSNETFKRRRRFAAVKGDGRDTSWASYIISRFSSVCLHLKITSVTHLCKKGRPEFGRESLLGTLQVEGEGLYAWHFVGSTEALNAIEGSLRMAELKAKRACASDRLRTLYLKNLP